MRSLFVRAGAAAVFATVAGLVSVSIAFAHAEPDTITPADGAVLTASPSQVVMTTTEEMDGSSNNALHVVNAAGTEVTTTAATVDATTHMRISVPLPPNLAAGVYTIKWSTVSAGDGDSAEGTFTFTIAAAQPTATATITAAVTPASPTVAPTRAPAAPGTGSGLEPTGGSTTLWLWAGALAVLLSVNVAVVTAVRRGQ